MLYINNLDNLYNICNGSYFLLELIFVQGLPAKSRMVCYLEWVKWITQKWFAADIEKQQKKSDISFDSHQRHFLCDQIEHWQYCLTKYILESFINANKAPLIAHFIASDNYFLQFTTKWNTLSCQHFHSEDSECPERSTALRIVLIILTLDFNHGVYWP